jgi:hypothetical protein
VHILKIIQGTYLQQVGWWLEMIYQQYSFKCLILLYIYETSRTSSALPLCTISRIWRKTNKSHLKLATQQVHTLSVC